MSIGLVLNAIEKSKKKKNICIKYMSWKNRKIKIGALNKFLFSNTFLNIKKKREKY